MDDMINSYTYQNYSNTLILYSYIRYILEKDFCISNIYNI